jgi:nucleoid-associated protein YgaU
MIRLACIVLAIALLPSPMEAQGLTGDRTHTVTRGDKLSEIAAWYLGAASDWVLVIAANRDRLTDPNVLQEGMQLATQDAGRIPGPSAVGRPEDAVIEGQRVRFARAIIA